MMLYIDDDGASPRLASLLRQAGHDVVLPRLVHRRLRPLKRRQGKALVEALDRLVRNIMAQEPRVNTALVVSFRREPHQRAVSEQRSERSAINK